MKVIHGVLKKHVELASRKGAVEKRQVLPVLRQLPFRAWGEKPGWVRAGLGDT
jgi:hypothetical protein